MLNRYVWLELTFWQVRFNLYQASYLLLIKDIYDELNILSRT